MKGKGNSLPKKLLEYSDLSLAQRREIRANKTYQEFERAQQKRRRTIDNIDTHFRNLARQPGLSSTRRDTRTNKSYIKKEKQVARQVRIDQYAKAAAKKKADAQLAALFKSVPQLNAYPIAKRIKASLYKSNNL